MFSISFDGGGFVAGIILLVMSVVFLPIGIVLVLLGR